MEAPENLNPRARPRHIVGHRQTNVQLEADAFAQAQAVGVARCAAPIHALGLYVADARGAIRGLELDGATFNIQLPRILHSPGLGVKEDSGQGPSCGGLLAAFAGRGDAETLLRGAVIDLHDLYIGAHLPALREGTVGITLLGRQTLPGLVNNTFPALALRHGDLFGRARLGRRHGRTASVHAAVGKPQRPGRQNA